MGVQNGTLYIINASEDEKQKSMVEAVALKDFADSFLQKDNDRDIAVKDNNEIDIKEILGIVDYDALSIAKRDRLTFVSAEIPISAMACHNDINVDCICISDFLADICKNWKILLKYTNKLMDYQFSIPISANTVKALTDIWNDSTEEVKMQIIEAWKDILSVPQNEYKTILVDHFKRILIETIDYVEGINPIWVMLMTAVLSYSNFSIQLDRSNTGEITARLIKNE